MRQFLQRNAYLFLTSFSVMLAVQVHGQGSGTPLQSPNNTESSRQTPPKKPATATGTGGSAAAPRGSAGTGTPPPGSAAPANDGLDPKYLEFEVLGMRFRPPVQSIMRADGSGITAQWTISERADPPRFVLRVSRLVASDATSTPAQQIDSYIKSVSERPSPNAVFAVRSRKEFELDGRPAALLYTSLREGTGDDEISAVQGYFILQIAPNEFVVISSLLAEQDFASVSKLLERSFRTMQVANQAALADERSGRIARGDHLLRAVLGDVEDVPLPHLEEQALVVPDRLVHVGVSTPEVPAQRRGLLVGAARDDELQLDRAGRHGVRLSTRKVLWSRDAKLRLTICPLPSGMRSG